MSELGAFLQTSFPFDGTLVLNKEPVLVLPAIPTQGVQVTRFNSTGSAAGTLNVATREDLLDNSHMPPGAVMALGDLSRSCGRDLLVADYFTNVPTIGDPAIQRLSYARCPFDADSRSFDRPAPVTPTCAVIADVTGTNGADLIVGTATDATLNGGGRVLVFRQTPGIPNRFAYEPDEVYLPQINGGSVNNAQINALASGHFGPGTLPDLVIGYTRQGRAVLQILRRLSSGAFTVMPEVFVGSIAQSGPITALAVADFDSDTRADVMVLAGGPNKNLYLARGLAGSGVLAEPVPVDMDVMHTGSQLAVALSPASGLFDLYTLMPDNPNPPPPFPPTLPSARILTNLGGGVFGSPMDLAVPTPPGGTTPTPVAVTTGRIQGIAAPYIACADFANNQIVVYVDFGAGYEVASSIVVSNSLLIHPTSIVATDLEADGDDDLVVGFDDGGTISILTCLGRGRFAPMTLPSGSRPRFVTVGDVDGNGLPDILEVGGDDVNSHLRVIFSNCGGM